MSDNGFNERVLAWLRTRDGYQSADSIVAVEPQGSDWNGDTEQGFYSSFSVDITFMMGGHQFYSNVEGKDMENLWKAVVA